MTITVLHYSTCINLVDNSDSGDKHCSNDRTDDSIQFGHVLVLIIVFFKAVRYNLYALQKVLFVFFISQMSSNTFEQLLREHAIANLNSTGGRQTLRIRCKHIWSDTKTAFSHEGFMCNAGLSIKFDGEEAIGSGGPLLEYFELLRKNLQFNGFLFTGPDNCRILTRNTYALNHNELRTFGVCIALALICGILSQAVLSYVLDQTMDIEIVDEIPSEDCKDKVKKVCIKY